MRLSWTPIRWPCPADVAAEAIVRALENDQFDLAIGDAARSREKRETLFAVMNP